MVFSTPIIYFFGEFFYKKKKHKHIYVDFFYERAVRKKNVMVPLFAEVNLLPQIKFQFSCVLDLWENFKIFSIWLVLFCESIEYISYPFTTFYLVYLYNELCSFLRLLGQLLPIGEKFFITAKMHSSVVGIYFLLHKCLTQISMLFQFNSNDCVCELLLISNSIFERGVEQADLFGTCLLYHSMSCSLKTNLTVLASRLREYRYDTSYLINYQYLVINTFIKPEC